MATPRRPRTSPHDQVDAPVAFSFSPSPSSLFRPTAFTSSSCKLYRSTRSSPASLYFATLSPSISVSLPPAPAPPVATITPDPTTRTADKPAPSSPHVHRRRRPNHHHPYNHNKSSPTKSVRQARTEHSSVNNDTKPSNSESNNKTIIPIDSVQEIEKNKKITHLLIRGKPNLREKLINKVRTNQIILSVGQFNEIVSALVKLRRAKEALQIVELAETVPSLKQSITDSKSIKTYTIMLDTYGRSFQLSKAFSLFYSMGRSGIEPNVITYNAMIAACSRSNEPDLAYEIYEEMNLSGLRADKFTFGALIDSFSKCGKLSRCFEISKQMDEQGIRKDETIYAALLDACGRKEDLNHALIVFEEMKRSQVWPNIINFTVLLDLCANTRQAGIAFEIFSEMKHWGLHQPNVIIYTCLINTCSKCGLPQKGDFILKQMFQQGVQPNQITFGALLEGWCRANQMDHAFSMLDQMISYYDVKPNAILIGGLIDACRKNRESFRIGKLWRLIMKYNLKTSKIYYPCLIVMSVMEKDVRLSTAIVLHAYARGCLRRASLSSEDPSLHAIACAMTHYWHEVYKNASVYATSSGDNYEEAIKRVHIVFKSMGVTEEEMNEMSSTTARNVCMTWGDFESDQNQNPATKIRTGTRRDRKGVYKREAWIKAESRDAKNLAFAGASTASPRSNRATSIQLD